MVVAAREIPGAVDEVGFDASDPMVGDDAQGLPYGLDDAAPSGDAFDDSEATEEVEEVPELDADTLTRARAVLNAEFEQQFAELRSTKDRENANTQAEARRLAGEVARLQLRQGYLERWLPGYLNEVAQGKREADPRDVYVLKAQLDQAEQQTAQQARTRQQQVTVGVQQALSELEARHHEVIQEWAYDGERQLFDPAQDPEIQASWQNLQARVRQHYQHNGGVEEGPAWKAAFDAAQQLKNLYARKGKAALAAPRDPKKEQAQKQTADALRRKQERGPQAVGKGSGGGAALNPAQILETAWERWPTDEDKRLQFIGQQQALMAAPQPRRNR